LNRYMPPKMRKTDLFAHNDIVDETRERHISDG